MLFLSNLLAESKLKGVCDKKEVVGRPDEGLLNCLGCV